MFSEDYVQKLKKTISFELLEDKGINREFLGESLISSGLLLNKKIYFESCFKIDFLPSWWKFLNF